MAADGHGWRRAAAIVALVAALLPQASRAEVRPNALGPPLDTLAVKLADRRWLTAFLLKPARWLPGTAMPDSGLGEQDAADMTAALRALGTATPSRGALASGGDAARGAGLFVARGCAGCHAVVPGEPGLGPNLSASGLKLAPGWLRAWLRDPRAYHPQTPMPKPALADAEIADLASYLLTLRAGREDLERVGDLAARGSVRHGRELLLQYECHSCHRIPGFPAPPAPVVLPPTETLLASREATLDVGRALVAWHRCRGCHRIEGEGGVIAQKLERETLAPPPLDGEGARVQPSWLIGYLRRPDTLRSWLEIRMPDCGLADEEARALALYFAASADATPEDEPAPAPAPEVVAAGAVRFESYRCAQCHPTSPAAAAAIAVEDRSIDLSLARRRLRPSWITRFLAKPSEYAGPATRMPAVFFDVDGSPKVARPEDEMAALQAYLLAMPARPPASRSAAPAPVDWTKVQY